MMIDLNDAPPQGVKPVNQLSYDQDAISRDLAASAQRWVPALFRHGRISADRSELRVADISGRPPRKDGSCVIRLIGDHAGSWCDWSGGETAKGGPISTIKEHLRLGEGEAFERAIEILHGAGYSGTYLLGEAARPNGHLNGATGVLVSVSERQQKSLREAQFLLENATAIAGTLAETYLLARSGFLPPAAFGPDPDLLFHPSACRSKREAKGYPTLIARLRYPDGHRSGGLHRTFLRDDGLHHVGGDKAKMMLGTELCGGAVIMLAPIGADGTLGVGEGQETVLAGIRYYGVPGWACGSDGGLKGFAEYLRSSNGCVAAGPHLPPIRLQRLLIWADRGEAGERAGWHLYRIARGLGIAAELYLPIGPDDFADDLAQGLSPAAPQPEPVVAADRKLSSQAGMPQIQVGGGRLSHNVDQAEHHLAKYDPQVFQRGDFLVRPAKAIVQIADGRKAAAKRLVRISVQHLIDRLTRIIEFQKYDARTREWITINCPADVAAALLQRNGLWEYLPHIRGITTAPTLRWDGSLLNKPGYDPDTGTLFDPGDVNFESFEIPEEPTLVQARAALNILISLIEEFPFVDEQANDATGKPSPSRSVWLSHCLSANIRLALRRTPLHGFDATAAGSGKTMLVDTSSVIATGHDCPVISPGGNPEEMEKRLGAALLAGDTLISFDNCEHPLGGEKLNQALTQSLVQVRILGKSEQPTVPSDALFSATGNNLTVIGDMGRRTIMARLDPKMEKPETRTFRRESPVERARKDRARYVAAALLVLRAFHVAGRPRQSDPLGSFEDWSRWVRDALIWLGEPDPCETMERTRQADPRRRELAAVLHQWQEVIGAAEVTAKRVIEYATERYKSQGAYDTNPPDFLHPDFREALLVVAGDKGAINSRRLGYWLRGIKGRVIDRMRIEEGSMSHGENRWRLAVL